MRPVFWLGIFVLIGCQEGPGVYRYTAPKIKTDTSHRLLGAITRTPTGTWFFKASGPAEKIAPIENQFRAMIESLRFENAAVKPVHWTLPEGWSRVADDKIPDSQFKPYALLKTGSDPEAPEVTLTRFGPRQGGDLNTNVTRWRKQIGLHRNRTMEVESSYRELTLPHGPVYLVDIVGPGPAETSSRPMATAVRSPHGLGEPGSADTGQKVFDHLKAHLVYVKPAGWSEEPSEEPGVLRHFVARSQGRRAEVLIQAVAAENNAALIEHFNRYTKRLNLPAITPDNLAQSLHPISLGDGGPQSGTMLDWTPNSGENGLVMVVTYQTGFPVLFHLYGDAVLVRRNKPIFEAFCRSFWFHGKAHD